MPTPQPSSESEQEWIARCMSSDEAMDDFPDEDQRFAFCQNEWDEATAENMSHAIHAARITARPQRDTLMGMEGWRIPATGVRETVLNNNIGRMFVPRSEIAKSVDRWNMMPVTLGHPRERGVPTSGRSESALNDRAVGFLTNARESGGELKFDTFLPDHRVQEFGIEDDVLNAVRNGDPVEVSTSFGGDFIKESGTHEGQSFDVVARNLQPDHFAILLDEKGACSVEDGCGLGVNHEGPCDCEGADVDNQEADEVAASIWERLKAHFTTEDNVSAENEEAAPDEAAEEQPDDAAAENETTEEPSADEQPPAWASNLVETVESLGERMDELEDAAKPALNEAQQERNRLTSEIAQSSDFDESELEEWRLDDLRKMRKSLSGAPGRPGPKARNVGTGGADFMPPTDPFADNSEQED